MSTPTSELAAASESARVDVDLTVSDDEEQEQAVRQAFIPKSLYTLGPKAKSLRKRSNLTTISSSLDEQAVPAPPVVTPPKKKAKKVATPHDASSGHVEIGSVGYKFRKEFDDGWYDGEVMELRNGAEGGKNCRCKYSDGDAEDLSLMDLRSLRKLARLDKGQHTKNNSSRKKPPKESPISLSDDDSSHFSEGCLDSEYATLSNESHEESSWGANATQNQVSPDTQTTIESPEEDSSAEERRNPALPEEAGTTQNPPPSDDEDLFYDSDDEKIAGTTQNPPPSDDEDLFYDSDDEKMPGTNQGPDASFNDADANEGSPDDVSNSHNNVAGLLPGSNSFDGIAHQNSIVPMKKKARKCEKPKHVAQVESFPVVERESKDVYPLMLQFPGRIKVYEGQYSSGPPQKVRKDHRRRYEIIYSELKLRKNSNGYSDDDMGTKYYRSYYMETSGPGLRRIDLASELSKIADWEEVTYEKGAHKTASRLKLLVSTGCKTPGSTNEYCARRLGADVFDIIPENGHMGCGFIAPDLLLDILGISAESCRVMAIQVRIVSPSKIGIAKGMLVAKEGIKGIEVPQSMVKVGPSTRSEVLHTDVLLNVIGTFPSKQNNIMRRLVNPTASDKPPTDNQMEDLKGLPKGAKVVLRAKGVSNQTLRTYESEHRFEHTHLVGVSDPTGCIPPGHVFLTGWGHLPPRVFLTRHPSTEAKDGVVVPVASARDLPPRAYAFLTEFLNVGAIVFPLGAESIPKTINGGDLDGDLYLTLYDQAILREITNEADMRGTMPDDEVVGVTFLHEMGQGEYHAVVRAKLDHDLYQVETGHEMNTTIEMTRDEIFEDKLILRKVLAHERTSSKSTKFHLQWDCGVTEWLPMQEIRNKFSDPPDELLFYVKENDLAGLRDCRWLEKHFGTAELKEITGHRVVKNRKIEVCCLYDDGKERWVKMKEAEEDMKLELGEYARENQLTEQEGWEKTTTYWLEAVQELYSSARSSDIDKLVKYLHKKHTTSNLAWEGTRKSTRKTSGVVKYDPNHEIPVTWGRAYKESLDIQKHGGKVSLPFAFYREVPGNMKKHIQWGQ